MEKEPKVDKNISDISEEDREKERERKLFKESLKTKSVEELKHELKLLEEQFDAIPREERKVEGFNIYTYEAGALKTKIHAIMYEIEMRE